MKVIILGDTHIPKRAKELPSQLIQELIVANLIIHTGDWQSIEVYEQITKYGEVVGVYGNVDDDAIKERLPKKVVIELNGFKFGVIHGDGIGKTIEKRVIEAFKDEDVDCIIFGHSHIPVSKKVGNTWLFNPGSPTDKRKLSEFSYGVLTIDSGIILNHVYFKKSMK
ncbi:metallophosphoesterase family protein [Cytobacillus sp. FJAT-54145]|uniref:Phosphoesterase n=1 Tax=Cytobacillus spartinae TaxID=3299023 RepID=A0ABW6KEQ7_9BACI